MQDKYTCSKLVSQQSYFVLIETKPQSFGLIKESW